MLYFLLLLIPGFFLLFAYIIYVFAFRSPNKTQNDDFNITNSDQMAPYKDDSIKMIETVRAIPYETVSIQSFDGLTLNGRYYKAKKETAWQENGLVCPFDETTAPLALLLHGWRGTPCRDFSGGLQLLYDAGFHVLAIEERACVTSEGKVITFGVKEHKDMLDWIRFAREELHADKILPVGISMGAATVLMNADKVPSSVFALVADCPYTRPISIIQKVGKGLHIPSSLMSFFAVFSAKIFAHFDLKDPEADAVKAVTATKLPILLIHGEDDRFVPCQMSHEIAKANPAMVELQTFPRAGHGLSYLYDKERYVHITMAFIARHYPAK